MKTIRLFITLCLCLNFSILFSQTNTASLKGVITDSKTGEGIPFANINIKDTLGQLVQGCTSDFDGKYLMISVPPGVYAVEASFQGYTNFKKASVRLAMNTVTVLDFRMQEKTEELCEVVITYSAPLIDKNKNVTIRTQEDIANMAVRDVSGISSPSSSTMYDAKGNVVIRGSRADGTLTIVDGVKIRGNVNLPQAAISSTEVVSGGLPAQYGEHPNPLTEYDIKIKQQKVVAQKKQVPINNEYYSSIVEIPFKRASQAPLSTFSSDVDVASYATPAEAFTFCPEPSVL